MFDFLEKSVETKTVSSEDIHPNELAKISMKPNEPKAIEIYLRTYFAFRCNKVQQ